NHQALAFPLLASVPRLSRWQIFLPQTRSARPPGMIMPSRSLTGMVLAVVIQAAPDHALCQAGMLAGQGMFAKHGGGLIVILTQPADVVRDACLRLTEKFISQ